MLPPDALLTASTAALETMFFTSILEPVDLHQSSRIDQSYKLRFEGDFHGEFALGISRQSAISVAANFLGLEPEEVSDEETTDVIKELTNMIAGSLLSGIPSDRTFSLHHPERDDSPTLRDKFLVPGSEVFELEDGVLGVSLAI